MQLMQKLKSERIAQLEKPVEELLLRNESLATTITVLRERVKERLLLGYYGVCYHGRSEFLA